MKIFKSEQFLERHVCHGVVGKKDLIYAGTKHALEVVDQLDFHILVEDSNENVEVFSCLEHGQVEKKLKGGWACNKKNMDRNAVVSTLDRFVKTSRKCLYKACKMSQSD